MTFYQRCSLLFLIILIQSSTHDCSAIVKRDVNEGAVNGSHTEGSSLDETEERNLEQEIVKELNHLSIRKQRQIFNDLEKQKLEKYNTSFKTLTLSESENLSPLNVEELKNIRNTIKTSNSSLPPIRNKRTLNFLLYVVARAMGYTLTPTNPDAEWIPRSQPTPCITPAPPCATNSPSVPPPCAMPPSTPPCPGSMQPATIPPNQIDANTINYPYRPLRTIPLFNFAPLPPGVRVPYPPLLQPPARQTSCPPQRPSSPCGATPAPSPPPCMPSPPPCGAAPSPPPCGTTPAPRPPPCKPTPSPPCGTTPAPRPPPPCTPSPPPCGAAPSSPPCASTPPPPPPCATTPPPPPPCETPCGNPPPKKGSILLEYDDPVRIQIFSNGKKHLPASGNIFSGYDDDEKKDLHSGGEKKDEDYEEKEEMEEEHFEEEEEDEGRPEQLKQYEEEDEKNLANEEEDESETKTNLSIVKKPADDNGRQKATDENNKKDEKENSLKHKKSEKSMKVKKPKTKKKWVRIVKKQRRKTKTDSNPQISSEKGFQNMTVFTSDSFPLASQTVSKFYGKRNSRTGFDSFEKDISDYSGDSSIDTSEDVTRLELKKVRVNDKALHLPNQNGRYEFNINPYHFLEPEEQRRQKLEKAVERYVEDYVEKQLGDELVKNTGVPKTTVFEFAPKNGPKIQTITTTIAKSNRPGNSANAKLRNKPEIPAKTYSFSGPYSQEENFSGRGDASYEAFAIRK